MNEQVKQNYIKAGKISAEALEYGKSLVKKGNSLLEATELIEFLKKEGYGVTIVDAWGATGKVNIIFTIVKRSDQNKVIEAIQAFNPKAFYSIEDIRSVGEGVFPDRKNVM